ncbi:RHS repeat-associated core domain-containing protein [Streptomyces sp. C11-1]|uniref:RHS repeat-associated core domain-containing protein n=1 Tax=Streptomyces durocortorensis TaxID=2811104 RepID=A0ABY9VSE2_9ACTN|nr:RHS repeat-associated core domain-containing protein [Streptomyces durocortorensis]WNF26844.1 RHS repeat-associated core domain-containing protein [Streptomyces durocortorensis]
MSEVAGTALNKTDETASKTRSPDDGTRWPEPGVSVLDVPGKADGPKSAEVGSLPVAVGTPKDAKRAGTVADQVQVQVLDRSAAASAGVDGPLLAVQGHGQKQGRGRVGLKLDYSGFSGLYGGDWASRLTLREVPGCALVTPDRTDCQPGEQIETVNDASDSMLSAEISLTVTDESAGSTGRPVSATATMARSATGVQAAPATALFAVTAAPSGATGDFTATTPSASASWEAGGASGGFSWSYDIETPGVPGGLEPSLGLSYSSRAVDGRTAATNNQANWIGDGWSMSPGSIERRYTSCESDRKDGNNPSNKVGDQCWKKDNATLSLGGSSSQLVKDDATGEWRKKTDDGTRIAQLKSTSRANGDGDGEYWRVTAPDGTRYYFGYNRLPGWTKGKPVTNSVWTVPVFGNHSGEPCHAAAFKDSWCQQGWRWNLDYAVDPHGNAMGYYWAKESNHYQRNVDASYNGTLTSYTRGGHLKRIDYGLRHGNAYTTKAAAKVDFTTAERCLKTSTFDCAADKFTAANAAKWPDVPFDQVCSAGDACAGKSSASYFTRKRLTGITTSVLDGGAYKKADSWQLEHRFPSTGDGTDPPLWLASIERTGHTSGTPVTLPAVEMSGQQLPNRVAGAVDTIPAYNRYRVYGIKNETGSTLGVTYSAPDCKAGSLPNPASNTKRCYPVIWSPPDAPAAGYEPYQDWFHSYVVTQILESDNTSGAPVKRNDYTYLGGLAWAKGDNEFTEAKHRTYGQSKGYGRVQMRTGDPAEGMQTLTETRYFRGIAGAQVANGEGIEVADHEAFAGMPRETATYNGAGGALVSATSSVPWHSSATASHSRSPDGLPTVHAYRTGVKKEETRTTITGGTLRRTASERTFDSYGHVRTESETGDTAKSGDEQCTTVSYARNTTANILTKVAESKTVATACDTTPQLPADLVSTERHYYDGSTTLGAAPAKGNETRRDENDGAGTGFITVNTAEYDVYGRQTSATDASGAETTVAYTPTTGQAPTKTVTTNALGHATTVHTDPVRGATTTAIDPNGKRTDIEYDALGRVTKVWGPGRTKADHPDAPATQYSYNLSRTLPNVVTTKELNHQGEYVTSYTFYDGLLRPRQTQSPAVGTSGQGRVVTETRYDTRGQPWKSYDAYHATGAPSATLVAGDDSKVPSAVESEFDGAGRPVAQISLKYGDETKRTSTVHGGDRTTVVPPKGGTTVTTIVNAQGQTSEARSYTNSERTEFQATRYGYNQYGKLAKVTDPAGTVWTWTYDSRGRQTRADDPDKGVGTTTYDDADRPSTVTDARGITLTTLYDELGRPEKLMQGTTVRSSWTYDSVAKGQPASDTRHVNGESYTTKVNAYDDRYQPTSATTVIPTSEQGLAGTYTWTYGYNQYTGAQEWLKHPAIGNLPAERVTTNANSSGLPVSTTAGGVPLVGNVSYDALSRPVRMELGTLGRKVYDTRVLDEHSGNLVRRTLDGDQALRIEDTHYSYDAAGNTVRISSTSGQDSAASTDTQCFAVDALRRMTDAWTTKAASDDCANGPSATAVGGPDSYWHSYSYDLAGNRAEEIRHTTAPGVPDITRTYTPGKSGEPNPHALRSITTTGGPDGGARETFAYDQAGNTESRDGGSRDQGYVWDQEGNLAEVTENGKSTTYLYDSSGNRILARNTNATTAYLPGGNQLTVATSGARTATRYYSHAGETVAVRTAAGINFVFANHQGTGLTAVGFTDGQAVTRRKQLPFGESRTATGTEWPGDRGFVGGTADPTGLTHLGAREYDPAMGRFLSVDPLILPGDPTQLNPYIYGNNNAATFSDPTGEAYEECVSGQYSCTYGKGGTGDLKKVEFGKNYKKVTKTVGGTISPNYTIQQNTGYKHVYTKGSGVSAPTAAQRAASAEVERRNRIEREQKAAEARQKKNNQDEGFWSGLKNSTVGQWVGDNWDGIKTGLTVVAFGACIVASAGACIMVGAAVATAKFAGDGFKTGNWDGRAYAKDLAWTAVGGGSAAAFGRAFGGAKTWREAYRASPWARHTVMTKVRPSSATKHAVVRPTSRIDKGATYGNLSVNAGFNAGFCGANTTSIGSYPGNLGTSFGSYSGVC